MEWWREARFGMFIHWGLYSIPAGAWEDKTTHGEWIRQTAQIPIEVYDQFIGEFNPLKFDADEWVRMAKAAGMKYIVLTSKHHDGFCLFNSNYTDFDIMNTPFKRDVLKELADACRDQGIKLCWYHSIMDWHHPDYLPRRSWEDRSADGAELDRYITYMKNQLKELITNYGDIGVLWFASILVLCRLLKLNGLLSKCCGISWFNGRLMNLGKSRYAIFFVYRHLGL